MKRLLGGLFIACLVLGLTSCSFTHRGDGPPPFNVDVSKIPNATPKPEPLAKYGNMSSYKVFGRRYYTMKSSKAFEQVGTASWYGTKFHAQRTSSGEKYDMLAMTAAHKTLPLPTYIEVTNLENHRQIIVKVNDRGPFSSNRIIDLSYVAAKKLGMLGRGTAKVKIRAINPYTFLAEKQNTNLTSSRSARRSTQHETGRTSEPALYVQAGAFASKNNALKLKTRLTAMLKVPVRVSFPTANSKLYRVQIGPLHDMAAADKVSAKLQSLGIKPKRIQGA